MRQDQGLVKAALRQTLFGQWNGDEHIGLQKGIFCKRRADHEQGKVPGPSGVSLKLKLRNQLRPRPGVGEGGTTGVDVWALLGTEAAY